ncbi:hypothetical protein K0B96_00970 [Horticoccus luteus]|uniref:Uncharacterized protein n=1 Tax=Horticoccus luteus TaxID=2862869 RepID=A0A8F9TWV2_9BACT|nr:hypothetical protein [Horticoccus luteus]QYM79218.1 hypothetical protein K0B96_00970 [Horticoccus luteus]
MSSTPHSSSGRLAHSFVRYVGSTLVAPAHGPVRTSMVVAAVILAVEVGALLFRVPGLGAWGRVGVIYALICGLGVTVFFSEMRRMKAALVFARREREARRLMDLPEDF